MRRHRRHYSHASGSTRLFCRARQQLLLVISLLLVGLLTLNVFFWPPTTRTSPPTLQDQHHIVINNRTIDPQRHDVTFETVIGMAIGYDLEVLERFVGSLRKTGYQGHIILGMAPGQPLSVLDCLKSRHVTVQILQWTACSYPYTDPYCAAPYPDLKLRWSRYALARDWLSACQTCTGPVLVTDVRDVVFQAHPFAEMSNNHDEWLQLFEEHPYQTTQFKLVKKPIRQCQGIRVTPGQRMLCSGTVMGSRASMLKYLNVMHSELSAWASKDKCRLLQRPGGDQAVLNYLYYHTDRLSSVTNLQVVPFGRGQVLTVGVWAYVVQGDMPSEPSPLLHSIQSGRANNVTDAQGFFVDARGSRSAVIHQFDRWRGYEQWLASLGLDRDLIAPTARG